MTFRCLPQRRSANSRICAAANTSIIYRRPPAIGPGGIFGARPDNKAIDLAAQLAVYPHWRSNGWLPVAGDGSGNYYVLTTAPLAGFVAFVDTADDPTRLDYLAATTLWQFLLFLFQRELGQPGWPFDPRTVLAEDPDLVQAPTELLPWRKH